MGVSWGMEESQEEGDCIPNIERGSAPRAGEVLGYWLFDGIRCQVAFLPWKILKLFYFVIPHLGNFPFFVKLFKEKVFPK